MGLARVTLAATDSSSARQQGCRFADRCPLVMEKCHTVEPPDVNVNSVLVKCHLYSDSETAPSPSASLATT